MHKYCTVVYRALVSSDGGGAVEGSLGLLPLSIKVSSETRVYEKFNIGNRRLLSLPRRRMSKGKFI